MPHSTDAALDYDGYNREERYICSHLFRLLHEPKDDHLALKKFLGLSSRPDSFRIYAEVALIRDAYFARKPNREDVNQFMNSLVRIVMEQEDVRDCPLYTELPPHLCDGSKTHPKQICQKAGRELEGDKGRVYGSIQSMFNAKPDLAICIGDKLLIYEAKLTLDFDSEQMKRTTNIGEVWKKLLFLDLGFDSPPSVQIRTIGLSSCKPTPEISWKDVGRIAEAIYPEEDRTRSVLASIIKRNEAE